MGELFRNLQDSIHIKDFIDVGIVAFIVYRALLLIRGTRAMQMLTGLGILGVGFFISSWQEIYVTHWLLSYFFDYLILIIIVLFQDDLRRALTHLGKNPFFSGIAAEEERENIEEIAEAAMRLAKARIGALVVLERETGLKNLIDTGSKLDSKVKSELLYSIFTPTSPIHDGAVIISGGRIAAAGCFLPLSKEPNIDKRYGTRHRAALGLTEDTDAIVVLVSEEAGEVHLVKNGKITMNLSQLELQQTLTALTNLSITSATNLPGRLKGWIETVRNRTPLDATKDSSDE